MSIIGMFIGFCYAMLFVSNMNQQFIIAGIGLAIGGVLDIVSLQLDGYIRRKKVMKKIRKMK